MNIDDQHIIDYIEGKLSKEEAEGFSSAIASDEILREAYHTHLVMQEALCYAKDEDLKNNFIEWSNEKDINQTSAWSIKLNSSSKKWSMLAASLLLLCAFAFLFYRNGAKHQRLFTAYYTEPIPNVKRDATTKSLSTAYSNALHSYVERKFDKAIPAFLSWSPEEIQYDQVQLLLIDSYVQIQDWGAAKSRISELLNQNVISSTTRAQLEWLSILMMIRTDDILRAQKELDDMVAKPSHLYFTQANSLRDKL